MPDIARSGTPSKTTRTPPTNCYNVNELLAGEAIAAMDACYIANTGRVLRATGAAAGVAARVRGFADKPASLGEAVTLVHSVNVAYGTGLTPGADYYLSGATPGALADAASTGGTVPIAYAVDDQRVFLLPPR